MWKYIRVFQDWLHVVGFFFNCGWPFYIRGNSEWGLFYLFMLQEQDCPVILQLGIIPNLLFMQDGANPHFANNVWLGWTNTSSPDLTLRDFYLWGWSKEQDHLFKPTTLNKIEGIIRQVLINVPLDVLRTYVANVRLRLEICIVKSTGAKFECFYCNANLTL